MAKVVWTEPALADLEAIAEYIALDKPSAATRLVRDVFAATERLPRFPKLGRIPPEIADLPYRELIVSPCRIFYRVSRGTIFIVHVMRGEQQLDETKLGG